MTDQPSLPALEATHLHRTFLRGSTAVHAIRDVSLTLDAGEFVSIQGPSGSGKSSLLHLLAGLDAPDTGTVHVDGTELGALDEAARTTFRRRRIGLVLQTFDLLPTLDAVDNVAVPAILDGAPTRTARARARELLDRVDLAHRADHTPGELSGGEQQRVCIARAIINDPVIVLADEPTAALDTTIGDEILALLRSLTDQGRTTMIATHDARAAAHADRTLRIVDGSIIWPERELRVVRSS